MENNKLNYSILKNNHLIAEFMGYENIGTLNDPMYEYYDNYFQDGCRSVEELCYHESWDWLMPVVTECHKIIENYGYDDDTRNYIDDEIFDLDDTLSEYFNDDKDAIYNRVIQFIKFYNEQNK